MRVKGMRIIQGKTASNDLKMSLGAMGHRQVEGSWVLKFESDRTGACEVNSLLIFEVSM